MGWQGASLLLGGAGHVCPPGLSLLCGPAWLPPDLGSTRAQQEYGDARGAGPSAGAETHSEASAQPGSQALVRGGTPVRRQSALEAASPGGPAASSLGD